MSSNISLLVMLLGVVALATPSTSRPLFLDPEFNREALEQLYVQAEAIVDTLNEETAKRHLSPLASKEWDDEAVAIREAVRSYVEEALSPSAATDVDAEAGKYFDALPPSATWGIDGKVLNFGDFALSPSDNAAQTEDDLDKYGQTIVGSVESLDKISPQEVLDEKVSDAALAPLGSAEADKVVENQQADEAPKPENKWGIDVEAEKYHFYSLSPADRLEDEKAAAEEIDAEAETAF